MNREEIITDIVCRLYDEDCLNTCNYESTDDLLEAVKGIIGDALEPVVMVCGRVLV